MSRSSSTDSHCLVVTRQVARKANGILGVEDGCWGGTIPPVMAELGTIHQQESQGDDDYVSPTTDRNAVEWGHVWSADHVG